MSYYKEINWKDLPINEMLTHIKVPNSAAHDHGNVIAIDQVTQNILFQLLSIDIRACSESKIMLVHFPPHTTINIHSDKPVEYIPEGKVDQCVFLPLVSCEELEWSWYNVIDQSKIFFHGSNGNWKTVPMVQYNNAEKVQSVVCDQPFIANIGEYHALRNHSPNTAIGISIRLMPWSYQQFLTCDELPPIPNLTLK